MTLRPYVIEDNVPLPRKWRPPSPLRTAIESLRVGQSFRVPIEQANRVRSITSSVQRAMRTPRYKVRPDPQDRENFARVWRVK